MADAATQRDDSLAEWIGEHDDALRSYIARRVRDHAQVDDLVQDTYVRLLRAGPGTRAVRNRRGFLFRIASNLITDAFRRRRTRQEHPGLDGTLEANLSDHGVGSPERRLIGRDRLAKLDAALAALTPKARACVHLVRFEGLSPREAAARLGLTEKAVSRQLERTLATLARQVVDHER
ncbi:RNA polymerase sigma factor [Phenylobacterium sp.]|uniref:RNA polymerase sigma factor n=1 Tax=Phenylobacterium sp. TaxID=1871053 RepID=UPI00301C794D